MMATAISGLSRTMVCTLSRSLRLCTGSSSITTSSFSFSFLAAADWTGAAAPLKPPPDGAGTVSVASVGGSNDDARGLADDFNIQRAQTANSPSPTAPPHWLKSDVIVFKEEDVI